MKKYPPEMWLDEEGVRNVFDRTQTVDLYISVRRDRTSAVSLSVFNIDGTAYAVIGIMFFFDNMLRNISIKACL